MNGPIQHLLLTLRLNFRSKMPVIYGYLVPILFLVGFAAVFHSVQDEFAQLLTITVLGGACFGMPTAMVAERERGIWRRYRLLPGATLSIILSMMVARLILVASSAILQILLAMWIYNMPWPAHPVQMSVAFLFVAFAFEGMGLVIAMLADGVPAVQALGQAIFLPMILIGGVGVPLRALPSWAQIVAEYMPGIYAVRALDSELKNSLFSLFALVVIGSAACLAATNMFRWDAATRLTSRQKSWIALALVAWAAVGVIAQCRSAKSPLNHIASYEEITTAQINSITYDDLSDDNSFVTPLVESVNDLDPSIRQWMDAFAIKLKDWPPGQSNDLTQRTADLLSVAAIADIGQFQYEGEVPYVVFAQLKASIPRETLERILAFIILKPEVIQFRTSAIELGIPGQQEESLVRDRSQQYAKKLLGRLLGKLG